MEGRERFFLLPPQLLLPLLPLVNLPPNARCLSEAAASEHLLLPISPGFLHPPQNLGMTFSLLPRARGGLPSPRMLREPSPGVVKSISALPKRLWLLLADPVISRSRKRPAGSGLLGRGPHASAAKPIYIAGDGA